MRKAAFSAVSALQVLFCFLCHRNAFSGKEQNGVLSYGTKKRLGSPFSRLPRRSAQTYYCTPCRFFPTFRQSCSTLIIVQYFLSLFKTENILFLPEKKSAFKTASFRAIFPAEHNPLQFSALCPLSSVPMHPGCPHNISGILCL